MSLPQVSIKRPVMAVMFCMVFIVFGLVGYFRIGVQEHPNITYPVITVSTHLPGAAPTLIDQSISKKVEQSVNTISGVHKINASSTQGKSSIQISFNIGTNMDAAFNEVQSKINHLRAGFPYDTQAPVITREAVNAEPVMLIAVYGKRTINQLYQYADKVIKPKLENVPGVGDIRVEGAGKEVVKIELDINKLAALKITPAQVQSAFKAQHVNEPGGDIHRNKQSYTLSLDFEYHRINQFKKLIVAYRYGAPIYLSEIATVSLGPQKSKQFARYDGKATVGLSIIKKSEGNTVAISKEVKARLTNEVKPLLPSGVKTAMVFDEAATINAIIHSLEQDAWLSILTAALVILLFLKSGRSTLVVVSSIPVSLLGAVAAMYFFHYTFNVVTLLGVILLVGVVVDDAIVVLENVDRHATQLGKPRMQAAMDGASEVVFAVLASSLSLVSIFIPVIFMGGIVGLMFQSFAVVVTVGVLVSLFVSMTLTPMLCSRLVGSSQKSHGSLYNALENGFLWIEKVYLSIVRIALKLRWVVLILAIGVVWLSVPIFNSLGKSFMPANNKGGYFYINVQTPEGSSVEYTKGRVAKVEDKLRKFPEISGLFASVGPSTRGWLTVNLVPRDQLKMPQKAFMNVVQKSLKDIPGIMSFISVSGGGSHMSFSIVGPNQKAVKKNAYQLYYALTKHSELGSIYLHMSNDTPTYKAVLDRELANSLGISASTVANTLMALGPGVRIGKFQKENSDVRHNVLLKSKEGQFTGPEDLSNVYMRGAKDTLVRLDTIAALEASVSPVEVTRLNMNYNVGFSCAPTITLNKAVKLVKTIAKNTLPPGYSVVMTGNAASMETTIMHIAFALIMIIVLMYMVLASQFNSFIQPFLVLVALPLALVGGLFALYIANMNLNIYSMIGMLLLMGLVAKNSILLIDMTNQLRAKGMAIREALLKACPMRMRPVLMTSLAIIFAMLPSALSSGPGSAEHRPLSIVIIGGMVTSTILTLIVVPSLYLMVMGGLDRLFGRKQKEGIK
jgi:hydrophobic/amphiphilic exporter-1 (mainly G- bacteria), HAE1 family